MIKILGWAALALAALVGPAAAETIKVGMSGGYFPFTFVQQDKLQGFEVDFMNAIAAKTGDTVEFTTMSFSGLIGALSSAASTRSRTRSPSPPSARRSSSSPSPTSTTARRSW